jgi:hypothetical protein
MFTTKMELINGLVKTLFKVSYIYVCLAHTGIFLLSRHPKIIDIIFNDRLIDWGFTPFWPYFSHITASSVLLFGFEGFCFHNGHKWAYSFENKRNGLLRAKGVVILDTGHLLTSHTTDYKFKNIQTGKIYIKM